MLVKRRQRMFTLIELAATLQEMPDPLSVWIEGLGELYRWGDLQEFRQVAAEMLAYERPAFPALVKLNGHIHPVAGIDIHGNRVVLQVLPALPTPDLSPAPKEPVVCSGRTAVPR